MGEVGQGCHALTGIYVLFPVKTSTYSTSYLYCMKCNHWILLARRPAFNTRPDLPPIDDPLSFILRYSLLISLPPPLVGLIVTLPLPRLRR